MKLLSRIFIGSSIGLAIGIRIAGVDLPEGRLLVDYASLWGLVIGLMVGGVVLLSASGR